jgi:hypothetical protein
MNQIFDDKLIELSDNISKDNLYIDSFNANSCVNDILLQLNIIKTSLVNISNLLNKSVYKKCISNNYYDDFIFMAKKSNNQAQIVNKFINQFDSKYSSDSTQFTLEQLDERIAALEEKIALLANSELVRSND